MRLRPALALLGLVAAAAAAAPGVLAQSAAKNVSPAGKGAPAAAAPAARAPAPAAPAPAAPATLAPGAPVTAEHMAAHRAAYRLTLDRVRDNVQIAAATGAMLYEVLDACEGWTTRQRFTLTLTDRDGQEIETTSDYSTYESKDGRRLRFSLTQTSQGAVSQRVAGEAELGPDGSGVVRYVEPEAKEERLPPGTLLPTAHTIRALNAARAGQRILVAPLFDGTQAEGAQDTTTVLSDWQGPRRGETAERFPMLAGLGSARMRVAFFARGPRGSGGEEGRRDRDQGGGAGTPDYEVSLRYFENGVADELKMDFGDFVVDGRLEQLQPVPGGC
ncbi:cell envelope integrity EipB family protein [Caldovatus aquaticus]|uniref:Cell envelope integrity EipB family protein n=1 Tax=Caldovatus aquaticus TaxID=2865671 RepID=A0ABS7F702_9PROT|nr:cell envelope integrity EipB family protein [Caldovatus aquaticus]MBW8271268.1 cell envelope integrity EipB family protein [Caldovatus aquaticus]